MTGRNSRALLRVDFVDIHAPLISVTNFSSASYSITLQPGLRLYIYPAIKNKFTEPSHCGHQWRVTVYIVRDTQVKLHAHQN